MSGIITDVFWNAYAIYLDGGLLSFTLTISITVVLSIIVVQRHKTRRAQVIAKTAAYEIAKLIYHIKNPANQPNLNKRT